MDPRTTISPWDVLERVLRIYRERADMLLPMSFGAAGLVAVVRDAGPPALLVEIAAGALFAGAAAQITQASVQPGTDRSVPALARSGVRALLPVIALSIVEGIVLALGIVVLLSALAATLLGATTSGVVMAVLFGVLLLIPGIALATRWAVVVPVAVLERIDVGAAFGRSRKLVRGNGWRVLGTLALILVPLGLLASLTGLFVTQSEPAARLIVPTVLATLTWPIAMLTPPVLYHALLETRPPADPQGDAA